MVTPPSVRSTRNRTPSKTAARGGFVALDKGLHPLRGQEQGGAGTIPDADGYRHNSKTQHNIRSIHKMRRSILITALAGAAAVLSYASASAQSVGVGVYAGPSYGTYGYDTYGYGPAYRGRTVRSYEYGPRVYGYASNDPPVDADVDRPARSGGCGTYYFWNGSYCEDARDRGAR